MSFTLTKLPGQKEEKEEPQEFTLTKKGEEPGYIKQAGRGVAQGGLDLLSMASLPLYPVEKALDYAFGLEDQEGLNPVQEQRYSKQFNTLEKMQNENYVPTLSELMDLSDDDMDYRTGTSLGAVQQMQGEIPEGGIVQEGVRRVTRSLPAIPFGAFPGLLGAEFSGLGAKEAVAALGASEGWQTAADIVGGLGYGMAGLFRSAAPAEAIVPYVAQRRGGIMQAIEKQAPRTVEQRINSLSEGTIHDFRDRINQITDRNIQQMTQFSAREIEDGIARETAGRILDTITPQNILPQTAWNQIQEGANAVYGAEQAVYTPMYESVRAGAQNIYSQGRQSANAARNLFQRLRNIRTSPAGYTQTANIVSDVIHDLTGISTNVDMIRTAFETGNTGTLDQIFNTVLSTNRVRADRLMDLSIRLGDAINYETLIPGVKNLLRPLRNSVKAEFRASLGNNNQLLTEYNNADRLYQRTADRFGTDAIRNLRSTQNPEKMTNHFSQPSNFENLLEVFGRDSPYVRTAERQIIQDIGASSTNVGRDTFHQLEPFLSQQADQAGRDIIALGDNLQAPGQRRALQRTMLQDVSEAITAGTPPNYTTRAMMTQEGYRLARDTFSRSASGREVFETLERKLVSDIFDPIVVNNEIDWARAATLLENPNTALVLEQIIGADGVAMMQNMQRYGQNITNNMQTLRNARPTSFSRLISQMNSPTKIMVGAIVGQAVAAPLWITGAATALVLKNGLASLITNQSALRAVRGLANPAELGNAMVRDVGIINAALQ